MNFSQFSDSDTVHMLWIGGELTNLERLSMSSFVANGHDVILHAYNGVKGVPPGVRIADANQILPWSSVFANTSQGIGQGGYAGFSDWFRYELLKRHRGWWCDTDVICLSHFSFTRECVVASSRENDWGHLALGCAIRLHPDDPLLNFCLDYCRNNNVSCLVSDSYISVGPALLQRGIRELNLQAYVASPDTFCPVSWRHVRFLISSPIHRRIFNLKRRIRGGERVEEIKEESKGLHLWNSVWKLGNIDVDAEYDSKSVYEILKKKYLK